MVLITIAGACSGGSAIEKKYEPGADQIAGLVNHMTQIMVKDVTNPPLAARFFAYTMLAGYEVVSRNDPSLKGFAGRINNYPDIKKPSIDQYSWSLAAMYAMYETAAALQPSGNLLEERMRYITDSCYRLGMDKQLINNSRAYGESIAKEILVYARNDGYRNISNYSRYSPKGKEGNWFPTPPGFFSAVEPYFDKVRPFTLDSASQFFPSPPVEYNAKPGSKFYQLTKAVYDTGKSLSPDQAEIAAFWDCNPFALQDEGHLQIGVKKISPGAHWMGIAGIVCKKQNMSFSKALEAHTVLAITLMDAFIACWNEKFRSNRVRPETVIRKLLDPEWRPLLQTPPFPEYLSGHSVISTAAAEVLTYYLGDSISFLDTVEIPYGLAPRSFASFRQAADEAAVSRFYGGIHFMDAITEGQVQGRQVGLHVIKHIAPLLNNESKGYTARPMQEQRK